MIYPDDFEQRLGFDRIRDTLKTLTQSTAANQMADDICFSTDYGTIKYELDRTFEMRTILMMENNFPSSGYVDTHFLQRVTIDGNFLQTEEMVALGKALEILGALTRFFRERENNPYPLLAEMAAPIPTHDGVMREIHRILDPFGRIRDNASPELATIRKDLSSKAGQITHRLNAILRQAQADGYADPDSSVGIRDGRAVIPVAAGAKRKVSGFVHDESATGRTAYIEPLEVVELNNQVRELEMAEKREIVRILVHFTDGIRPVVDELIEAGEFIATVDFVVAKAKYAISTEATRPIFDNETKISLRSARHPLLEKTLKSEGKPIVPLDLSLTRKKHILLISGPNAGGKSVCLKTVGLLQYMLQCGLLVPTLENSEMGVFDSLLLDIGDQQSMDNDLSTYSSHLTNMKHFLRSATGRSMVLIDEFGGGTEPNIGGAIAESVLEQLRLRGTFGVITTHYANLKYYGTAAQGIENGAMTFDVQHIAPLFRLEQGRAGSSFALEIARKIGLPEAILQSAQEKIGVDQVNIEKQLRDAARDKRYWESKRDRIRQAEKGVERTAQEYASQLAEIRAERAKLIKEAKVRASEIISEANRQIESTIREIKEAQAEKERTRSVRDSFNRFKESLADNLSDEDVIARKMEQLREREARRAERAAQRATEKQAAQHASPVIEKPKEIELGMLVKIEGQTTVGQVLSIDSKRAVVAFGSVSTKIDKQRLVPASSSEVRRSQKITEDNHAATVNKSEGFSTLQRRVDFKENIDLRGMRGAEALELVKLFIDDAIMFGADTVRILHGKGTGALKLQIREYLSTEPCVRSVQDEHVEMGGAGITVVTF